MIEIKRLFFLVLPRWIAYTHWAPEALFEIWNTDTVGAMETLVPPSRTGLVIPMCKYTTLLY